MWLVKIAKNIVRDLLERERLFVILNSLVTTFTVITVNDVTLVCLVFFLYHIQRTTFIQISPS